MIGLLLSASYVSEISRRLRLAKNKQKPIDDLVIERDQRKIKKAQLMAQGKSKNRRVSR